jgi:raffinose/stachyose/melibiose transport system permease protein
MSKARTSPIRTGFVHLALIAYTLVAIFPVFLTIINSFKDRNAIFREPLRFPTPSTFSLVGYQTVLGQGDFATYFQNSFIVTIVSIILVLLFGAMAAFALSEYRFRGNMVMGLYMAIGIMIPIRLGTVAILQGMVAASRLRSSSCRNSCARFRMI